MFAYAGVEKLPNKHTKALGLRTKVDSTCFKDVRAHCYCASLLRTQIHTPRYASSARAKKYNN